MRRGQTIAMQPDNSSKPSPLRGLRPESTSSGGPLDSSVRPHPIRLREDACLTPQTTPLFDQIDTFVIRVTDYEAAVAWYAATLGLRASFTDPAEGLAVLPLAHGTSLTLWQCKTGECAPARGAPAAFPIFATPDAAAALAELKCRGVRAGSLVEGAGVRYFDFQDLDGNRLEACQVLVVQGPSCGQSFVPAG